MATLQCRGGGNRLRGEMFLDTWSRKSDLLELLKFLPLSGTFSLLSGTFSGFFSGTFSLFSSTLFLFFSVSLLIYLIFGFLLFSGALLEYGFSMAVLVYSANS